MPEERGSLGMKIIARHNDYDITVFANIAKNPETNKYRVIDYILGDIRDTLTGDDRLVTDLDRAVILEGIESDDEFFRWEICQAVEREVGLLIIDQQQDNEGFHE